MTSVLSHWPPLLPSVSRDCFFHNWNPFCLLHWIHTILPTVTRAEWSAAPRLSTLSQSTCLTCVPGYWYFYLCTSESILMNYIHALCKEPQQVGRPATTSLVLSYPLWRTCLGTARSIITDVSHPNHELFTLLPSGIHCNSLCPPHQYT